MFRLMNLLCMIALSITVAFAANVTQADEFRSYSHSSQSSCSSRLTADGLQIDVTRTPLAEVLGTLCSSFQTDVMLDAAAQKRLGTPITFSGLRLSIVEAFRQVAAKSGLHLQAAVDGTPVITGNPYTRDELQTIQLVSLRMLAKERALRNPIPVMLFHTPLDMGLQMAEGFAGVPIRIDHRTIHAAGLDIRQAVSLNSHNITLTELLDRLLPPRGLGYIVDNEGILVTTAKAAAATSATTH